MGMSGSIHFLDGVDGNEHRIHREELFGQDDERSWKFDYVC